MLKNKNILIGITGSIAAYKVCDIIRILKKEGANVQAIMTASSKEFIGKTTIAALTNNAVIDNIFDDNPKSGLEHINLAFVDKRVIGHALAAFKKVRHD